MRILSIDMDFITTRYGQYIINNYDEVYNKNANMHWENIRLQYGDIHEDFKPDIQNLVYIFEVFSNAILNSKKVVFSNYHDCILNELDFNKTHSIINIDHHHDLFYFNSQKEKVERYSVVSDADWVWYLLKNNYLMSYTWIHNPTSSMPKDSFYSDDKRMICKFLLKGDYTFKSYDFDLVFVCLSPIYISPIHWHYFELLKVIYKNTLKKDLIINNKRYEIDFQIGLNNSGSFL